MGSARYHPFSLLGRYCLSLNHVEHIEYSKEAHSLWVVSPNSLLVLSLSGWYGPPVQLALQTAGITHGLDSPHEPVLIGNIHDVPFKFLIETSC